jgi:hypothetical protein
MPRSPGSGKPDLSAILHRFSDALALASVAYRSLEAQEIPNTSQEVTVLRAALDALDSVYNDIDATEASLRGGT